MINGPVLRVGGTLQHLPIATFPRSNGGVLGILTLYGVQISCAQQHRLEEVSGWMIFSKETYMEPLGGGITLTVDFKWLSWV